MENFEVRLNDKSGTFVAALILSQFKADQATKVWNNKKNTIYSYTT